MFANPISFNLGHRGLVIIIPYRSRFAVNASPPKIQSDNDSRFHMLNSYCFGMKWNLINIPSVFFVSIPACWHSHLIADRFHYQRLFFAQTLYQLLTAIQSNQWIHDAAYDLQVSVLVLIAHCTSKSSNLLAQFAKLMLRKCEEVAYVRNWWSQTCCS